MSKVMNQQNVDAIITYALAVASQGDHGECELGEIHLLKYVYLADLAYAEAHAGETFTATPWQFYKFGPWAQEVHARIRPVVDSLGADERIFTSPKFEGEGVRWQLRDADEVLADFERRLPWQVARSVKNAVRKFGDDTSELLHHVYATPPMLEAAPNERLVFKGRPTEPVDTQPEAPALTDRQRKKRRKALDAARIALRAKLQSPHSRLVPVSPAPRYDETFAEGQRALDSDAGEPIEPETGVLTFATDIWKSRGRRDAGDT